MNAQEQHTSLVRNIQSQVRQFYAQKQKVKIYHGSTNSSRAQKFEKNKYVDISKLGNVIEINVSEQYVLVEPNVPMDALVDSTLSYNLLPPVVMELPGITVGGGIQGGAAESSSFKYGLFHDTCIEYEIVLGNGELVTASRETNRDLFYGVASSYGTIGIITLVKLRLIQAAPYVELTYIKTKSYNETTALIDRELNDQNHFVDAIQFSRDRGVVMVGTFIGKKNDSLRTFLKRDDEWFYVHVDKISKDNGEFHEVIPVRDYLFRYDRGAFWLGYYFFKFYRIPFVKLLRYCLDSIMHTRTLIRLAHSTQMTQKYFIQDLCLPKQNILSFTEYVGERLGIMPLWLCPLRVDEEEAFSPTYLNADYVINVGVWGEGSKDFQNFVKENRDIEKKVSELGERKTLYAQSYYTRRSFGVYTIDHSIKHYVQSIPPKQYFSIYTKKLV